MEMFSDKFRVTFQEKDELLERINSLTKERDFSGLNEIRRSLKKYLTIVEERMDEVHKGN